MGVWGQAVPNAESHANDKYHHVKGLQRRSILPDEGSLLWNTQYADRTERVVAGYGVVDMQNNANVRDFTNNSDAIEFLDTVLAGIPDFRLIYRGSAVLKNWRVVWPGPCAAPPPDLVYDAPRRDERVMAWFQNGDLSRTTRPTTLSRHRRYMRAYTEFLHHKDHYLWIAVVRNHHGLFEVRARDVETPHCNADGVHRPNTAVPNVFEKLGRWRGF